MPKKMKDGSSSLNMREKNNNKVTYNCKEVTYESSTMTTFHEF